MDLIVLGLSSGCGSVIRMIRLSKVGQMWKLARSGAYTGVESTIDDG